MSRLAVINVVGLTPRLIGAHTPNIARFAKERRLATIDPVFPAVTCPAQATYLTGRAPSEHGIVGNGWYHRELAEVHFWKQPNQLVHAEKVWETLRPRVPGFTCAQLFWWYNMYAAVDYSITPRPMYPADGRKVFDIYTEPFSIRSEIKQELGDFPFPHFWGPMAGIESSRWIAGSARWIEERHEPTLSLIYLPHLDYNLQRFGPEDPSIPEDLRQIDACVGSLIDFFSARSVGVLLLSEYGITPVSRPIHLNRAFRQKGWIRIKEELGRELLDYGASRVFCVADHQAAHIYVNDASLLSEVRRLLESIEGVEKIYAGEERAAVGLDHGRAGDIVVAADEHSWFTYYYWFEDRLAPDFARCVDIHRKPGYDPAELFIDPAIRLPKVKAARRLLQKKLGFRMLMDLIPLDATLVRGSHGRIPADPADHPILIGDPAALPAENRLPATAVRDVIIAATEEGR